MLQLIRTTSDDPRFRELVVRLDQELWSRYGAEQAVYDKHNRIEDNKTVVLAHLGNETVGCGCFKSIDDASIEIKRMYVSPHHRGKGIALAMIAELERWALEKGFTRAILETGDKQPEAVTAYKKAGYKPIPNYGPYIGMKSSICMEKVLSASQV